MFVGEIVVEYLIIFHKLLFIGVQQNEMNTQQLNSKCNHVKWWCGLAIHCKESSASNGLNKEMSWKSAAIRPGKDKKIKKKKKEESCDYSRESFGSNRNNLFPAKFRSVLPFYQNKPFASPKWTISTSVQIRATRDNLSRIRHALVATNAWTAVKSTGCNCKLVSCFSPAIQYSTRQYNTVQDI